MIDRWHELQFFFNVVYFVLLCNKKNYFGKIQRLMRNSLESFSPEPIFMESNLLQAFLTEINFPKIEFHTGQYSRNSILKRPIYSTKLQRRSITPEWNFHRPIFLGFDFSPANLVQKASAMVNFARIEFFTGQYSRDSICHRQTNVAEPIILSASSSYLPL